MRRRLGALAYLVIGFAFIAEDCFSEHNFDQDFFEGAASSMSPKTGTWSLIARFPLRATTHPHDVSSEKTVLNIRRQIVQLAKGHDNEIITSFVPENANSKNGFIIFDLHGPNNFRYAGVFVGDGVIAMGRYYLGDHLEVAKKPIGSLGQGGAIDLSLSLDGTVAHLNVNGHTLEKDFGKDINDGAVGIGNFHASSSQFNRLVVKRNGSVIFNSIYTEHLRDFKIYEPKKWESDRYYRGYGKAQSSETIAIARTGSLSRNFRMSTAFAHINKPGSVSINGGFVFDYKDQNNFKYAIAFVGSKELEIGEFVRGQRKRLKRQRESRLKGMKYIPLELEISDRKARLKLEGGSTSAQYVFSTSLNRGQVGIGNLSTSNVGYSFFSVQ